jgi:nicotinamidase-related amidase
MQLDRRAAATLMLGLAAAPAAAAPPRAGPTLNDLRAAPRPKIDPARAALVIIDAQNEYLDGRLKLDGFDPAVDEIVRLRDWARDQGVLIVHVWQTGGPAAPIFAEGSRGGKIVDALTPRLGEEVVAKTHPNSFHRTSLDAVLRAGGRDQVVLTGFMAHMCLDASARAAFDLGYAAFVPATATADRALPDPTGGPALSGPAMVRASLTALNDRFAWVLPDAAAVRAG